MIAEIIQSFWQAVLNFSSAVAESRRQRARELNSGCHWY